MLAAHRIVREGQRLNALTARLIELILLNRDHPAPSPVFARPLVEEAAETLLPLAHERGAELSYLCADAIIEGDGALLRVLLNNLADNALKSGAQHVRIEGVLAGERFTLTVQDDGCGMDETALRHITEPFYRVDKSRSRAQGGAGLGLSLCAEIARLHAADLSFESALGKGTRVTLSMPGKEAAVNDEA